MPASLRRALARPRFWWLAFAGWILFLAIYDSVKIGHPGIPLNHIDKLYHFGYFFAGAFAVSMALDLSAKAPSLRNALIVLTLFAVLGAADEFYQSFQPHRSGNDLGDWIADMLGALAGLVAARRFLRNFYSCGVKNSTHDTGSGI
ncbi:hypothetical protein BH23VER1_BH23VER1_33280 [soil metagenome]